MGEEGEGNICNIFKIKDKFNKQMWRNEKNRKLPLQHYSNNCYRKDPLMNAITSDKYRISKKKCICTL